jgi:RNA polymerase sigma-70 factor (ECF subfamily)
MQPDLDQHLPAIVAGDPEAFGRWVAGAEPALRGALRRFAADVDAEAVLQEGLLRIWQVAPRFAPDGAPNSLLRLAHRVVRNLALSELRKTRPDMSIEDTNEPAIVVADPDPMLRRAIDECREKLPGKPSAALAARLASAGAEPDETLAARLGMKTNTFLQNFTRARKLIADCLEKRGVDLQLEMR